jgi:hypothetical protein
MKRRKFLKNTFLTAVGTVIPAGLLAGMTGAKKAPVFVPVMPEGSAVLYDSAYTVPAGKTAHFKADSRRGWHRIYRMEHDPASRTVIVQGLDENGQVMKEIVRL